MKKTKTGIKRILCAVLCACALVLSACNGELTYAVYDDGENTRYSLDFAIDDKAGLNISEAAFKDYVTQLLDMYGFTATVKGLSFSAEKSVPNKDSGGEGTPAKKSDELFFIKYSYDMPHPLAEYAATDFDAMEKKAELDVTDPDGGETRHNVYGSPKGYDDNFLYVLKYGFWKPDGLEIDGDAIKFAYKQIKPVDEALGAGVLSYFKNLSLNFCYILPVGWHSDAGRVYRRGGYDYHTWSIAPGGGAAARISFSYYYPSQWIWWTIASFITAASVFVMYFIFKPKKRFGAVLGRNEKVVDADNT